MHNSLKTNAADATAWPNAEHARAWMRSAVFIVAGDPELSVFIEDARDHDPNADAMFLIRVASRYVALPQDRFVQVVDDDGAPIPVMHGSGVDYPDRYADGPHEDPDGFGSAAEINGNRCPDCNLPMIETVRCAACEDAASDDDEVPGGAFFPNPEIAILMETREGWFVVPEDQTAGEDFMNGPHATEHKARELAVIDEYEIVETVDADAVVVAASYDAARFPCAAAADEFVAFHRDRIKREHGGAILRATGLKCGGFVGMITTERGVLLGYIGATPGAEKIVKVAAEDLQAGMILKVPDIGRWSEQDEPGRRETVDRVEWEIGSGGLDVVVIRCASGIAYRSEPFERHPVIMPIGGGR